MKKYICLVNNLVIGLRVIESEIINLDIFVIFLILRLGKLLINLVKIDFSLIIIFF